jgi:hypothetical protein
LARDAAVLSARAKFGIENVAMHDLRRTLGTFMSRLGVPKDVRERILNHGGKRKGSITEGVYNHYNYHFEKRAALELWAVAIDAIVGRGPTEIDGYRARLARLKGGRKDQTRLKFCWAALNDGTSSWKSPPGYERQPVRVCLMLHPTGGKIHVTSARSAREAQTHNGICAHRSV